MRAAESFPAYPGQPADGGSPEPGGLLDVLKVAAVVLDAEGRITLWSPQAEELFGYTSAEALGRFAGRPLVHEQHLELVVELFARVMAGGGSWAGVFPVRHKDGATRLVEFRNMRLEDGSTKASMPSALPPTRRCTFQTGHRAEQARLCGVYRTGCQNEGAPTISSRAFAARARELAGLASPKEMILSNSKTYYPGIGLLAEEENARAPSSPTTRSTAKSTSSGSKTSPNSTTSANPSTDSPPAAANPPTTATAASSATHSSAPKRNRPAPAGPSDAGSSGSCPTTATPSPTASMPPAPSPRPSTQQRSPPAASLNCGFLQRLHEDVGVPGLLMLFHADDTL